VTGATSISLAPDVSKEVERFLSLGATRADVGQTGGEAFEVRADPEGYEFCVLHHLGLHHRSVCQVPAAVPGECLEQRLGEARSAAAAQPTPGASCGMLKHDRSHRKRGARSSASGMLRKTSRR
jgi:hypothetical protein